MIVVDASVLVELLVGGSRSERLRARLESETLVAPDIVDTEVASALRGLWLSRKLESPGLDRAVEHLGKLRLDRQPSMLLVPRAMRLRANLTSYDAVYVALAELLGCTLLTKDRRIATAPGTRCEVEVT